MKCICGHLEDQHLADRNRDFNNRICHYCDCKEFKPTPADKLEKCIFQWHNGYAWGKVCGLEKDDYSHREGGDHKFMPAQPTPQSAPEGPYKVIVDDHSDDCGTVYLLSGPKVNIFDKDEDLLKERVSDFNHGFIQGQQSLRAELEAVRTQRDTAMTQRFEAIAALGKQRANLRTFTEWYSTGLGVTVDTPRGFKETMEKLNDLKLL